MASDRTLVWTHRQAVVGLGHKCHSPQQSQRPQSGEANASGDGERNCNNAKVVAPDIPGEQADQHQSDRPGKSKLSGFPVG
jgi:hypothetical protein